MYLWISVYVYTEKEGENYKETEGGRKDSQ